MVNASGNLPRYKLARDQQVAVYWHCGQGPMPMTDEQLADMHRLLAEYHRGLVKEAVLDVVQQYHADLAQRLADEAAQIPRRTAIVQRLHEREQQIKDEGE
jgi:hypothetical protein